MVRQLGLTFLALLLLTPVSLQADLVDFDNAVSSNGAAPDQWAYGALTNSINSTPMGGNPVVPASFTFTGTTFVAQPGAALIEPTVDTPFVTPSVSAAGSGLLWRMDAASPGDSVSLVIDFSMPVHMVSFNLMDIDLGGVDINTGAPLFFQDQVTVTGGAGGGSTAYVASGAVLGTSITQAANTFTAVAGTDIADNLGTNNLNFMFTGPVDKITIENFAGPDVASPGSQWIALSDISFNAVPEPSAFAFLGLVGACVGVGSYVRKRKSQKDS